MTNKINVINPEKFTLSARGQEYTLIRKPNGWTMYVVNAMVRAYRNGFAIGKDYATIAEVESRYKAWEGIAAIVHSLDSSADARTEPEVQQ